MRVLVCGDRNWTDGVAIRWVLAPLTGNDGEVDVEVCNGDCRGADRLATVAAEALGIPVTKFPADWERFGKSAGPIRNRQMLKEFKPDLVLAFHADIGQSKGTRDMVKAARAAGIEVQLYDLNGRDPECGNL